MDIFNSILICSDIDGTFEKAQEHPMPQKNIDAINYFKERGGLFTFCTGRLSRYFKERGFDTLINAPACLCNGAIIYDFKSDRALKESRLCHTTHQIVDACRDYLPITKSIHLAAHGDYIVADDPFDEKYNINPNKMVWVFEKEDDANRFESAARARFDCYDVSKSWPFGVELVDKNSTKGHALNFIKKHIGAHTSVGVGNYGNDLSLLQHADIAVAVNDAQQTLKQNADIIVCNCTENAIADLVFKLDKYLLHGDF